MNKKISTLFTAGLLMTGALLGTANAQTVANVGPKPAEKIEAGKKYVMVLAKEGHGSSDGAAVYGFPSITGNTLTADTLPINLFSGLSGGMFSFEVPSGVSVTNYVWTVTEKQNDLDASQYTYGIQNFGLDKALRVDSALNAKFVAKEKIGVQLNTQASEDATLKTFAFSKFKKYDGKGDSLMALNSKTRDTVFVDFKAFGKSVQAGNFKFYELRSTILNSKDGAAELNALYNNAGFSLEVQPPVTGATVEENLFGEKRVLAYYLETPVSVVKPGETELAIPAGMYFFTETAGALEDKDGEIIVENWLNSTVIVASSVTSVEVTDKDRLDGQGFILDEVMIKQMNLYSGNVAARKSSKDELPIGNAAFILSKSFSNGEYAYGLGVKNFRYLADIKKDDHLEKGIELNTKKILGSYNLVSMPVSGVGVFTDITSIFALAESTAIKGIDLLNKTAKAAVYNILLIKDGNVTTLNNKYLTVGNNRYTDKLEWAAKSSVFAELSYPSYQFVISEIATNGTGITFTNRETGKSIKATLYPTDDENVYEWSVGAEGARPVWSNKNTYGEITTDILDPLESLNGCSVKLIKVDDVDAYAGFGADAAGTLVTMGFARDRYETSNKLYTAVDVVEDKPVIDYEFATSLSKAAQWLLVKKDKSIVTNRTIAYSKGGKVAYMAKGDTIIAEQYALEYVKDGQAQGLYLNANLDSEKKENISNELLVADPEYYSIKLYKDGSLAFIADAQFDAEADSSLLSVKDYGTMFGYENVKSRGLYEYNGDKVIRMYLFDEAIEISLPGNEGHVSLESEMGNYISMDQDRAAIVVDNEENTFYLHVADEDAIIPSFYISCSLKDAERMYMFNPEDSVNYYVGPGKYDRKYQWAENVNKVLFKQASINETRDTLTTSIKGETKQVASEPDNNNKNIVGGLENFKYNIIQAPDADGMYLIRSKRDGKYLNSINEKMTWSNKIQAMKFTIASVTPPVSNEEIEAGTIKVVAGEGNVTVYGAAGKKVTVSNVLGKGTTSIATSDSQVIPVAQGVAIIAVEGEAAVKAIVK